MSGLLPSPPGPRNTGRAKCLPLLGIPALLLLVAAATRVPPPSLPEGSWLDLSVRPAALAVHTGDDASDAVAHLTVRNRSERALRITAVRIVYLDGTRTLRVDEPGDSFFDDAGGTRSPRIERGGRAEWPGVCLERIPESAAAARIELDLLARGGPSPRRIRQAVEVSLRRFTQAALLRLPFEGPWRVTQGHGCGTDHRHAGHGAEFAWDFVAVDSRTGRPHLPAYASSRRNRDTVSFGRPVLAPVEGRVVRIEADFPDNDGQRNYPPRTLVEDLAEPLWNFGNFVVVAVGDAGPYLLFAHLRQGSIHLAPGAEVHSGDVLGEVGNSGHSIEPHLHLQLMDRDDPSDSAVSGIPTRFRDYLQITSRTMEGSRDSFLRRVSAGDPAEGSVVLPAPPAQRDESAPHPGAGSAG